MNSSFRVCIVGLAAMVALAGCSNNSGSSAGGGSSAPSGSASTATNPNAAQIAVIPKGTTHEYWKSIHAGAEKAAEELTAKGVPTQIIWKGPVREDDRNAQVDVVQTFLTQKVSAMVIAPLDADALVRSCDAVSDAGIPVVVIDSALNSKKPVSFVATNNYKGGGMAADEMVKELGGKGNVVVMRYEQGSESTEQREKGFLDEIAKTPGITIISSNQYAGATVDTAFRTAQNLVTRFGTQAQGWFAPNESSARGMLLALKSAGLTGKVKFVGFDTSQDLIAAINDGDLDATVVQDPFKMGYLGVMTASDALNKKTVPASIDTGVALVTNANINSPDIQAKINPPIDQYLK
jgi:ribose transport system substrate-binding protein